MNVIPKTMVNAIILTLPILPELFAFVSCYFSTELPIMHKVLQIAIHIAKCDFP